MIFVFFKKYLHFCLVTYFYLISNAFSSDLDKLFLELKTAPNTISAKKIENKIWQKWLTIGNDKFSNLQMKRGVVLLENGELDKALNLFVNLSKKQPHWAEPINKIATIKFIMGDYLSSVYYIKQTLSLEPRHFGAISGLTQINIALKKYDEALKNLDHVTSIYPLITIKKLRPFILNMLKKSYI
jgi:tetratricopeptide (TPR) repeat protein